MNRATPTRVSVRVRTICECRSGDRTRVDGVCDLEEIRVVRVGIRVRVVRVGIRVRVMVE